MTTEIINILTGIGGGAIICVLIFYFWAKKIITEDIVVPLIKPLQEEVKSLKEGLKSRDEEFKKMNANIEVMTKSIQKIEMVFDLLKGKLKVSIEE